MKNPHDVLQEIRARVLAACARAHRSADSVTLIGASKSVDAARVLAFARAGLRDFGENYVQEAIAKQRDCVEEPAQDTPLHWHFIGALQSNKAREVAGRFALIHSIDRFSLAQALEKALAQSGATQNILLQINIGAESTKSGCAPDELPQLLARCRELSHLRVLGLMCLPPFDENAENSRPFFRQMQQLGAAHFPAGKCALSMGMTNNFEIAIEEGATHIRVGTAIFGARRVLANA
jgi:pyridoxal phosphate enzyme (YggS family)